MEQKYCYGCMQAKTQSPVCEHCGFDDRKENEAHQLPLGTVLQNQYIVGRVLGQGGFGITYIGWDRNLAIPVAIKEFFPNGTVHRQCAAELNVTCYTGSAEDSFVNHRDRFLREARTLAQLSGVPEIVQVRTFFAAHNTAYIIMEYVKGTTLKSYLKQLGRRMTVQEVLDIMRPVLRALSKVHAKQLVHRDISPDNIMLPVGGGVKIIDFGTVRNMDNGNQTKSTESIMKPGFAPIEQYQTRGNLGTWTDVYALSATIHYCMTGRVPEDALERLENGGALTHLQTVPGLTTEIRSVLEKGLAVRIADRIKTVDEMYQLLYGEPVQPAAGSFPVFRSWQQTVGQQPDRISQLRNPSQMNPTAANGVSQLRNPDQMNPAAAHPVSQIRNSGQQGINPVSQIKQDAQEEIKAKTGGVFAAFDVLVPNQIIRYCESVSHKPVLVETYLNQCVNVGKLADGTAKKMLEHYNKNKPAYVPKPAVSQQESGTVIQDDGTVFGCFKMKVPYAVLEYCESVAHKPILVETYLQQCVNRERISKAQAKQMLDHYQVYTTKKKTEQESIPVQQHVGEQTGANIFCTECGRQIPGTSKFCCHCGSVRKSAGEDYPRWYCESCKAQIPVHSKYCGSCGKNVSEPIIRNNPEGHCPKCGVRLMPGSKFCFSSGASTQVSRYPQGHCQSCGKKLSDNAKFCVYCGTPVNSR